MLWVLPLGVALLLLLAATHWPALWQRRKRFAEASAGLIMASLPFIWAAPFAWPTALFLSLVQLWTLLLAVRLLFGRLDEAFIRSSTWQNSLLAMGAVGAVLVAHSLVSLFVGLQDYELRINVALGLSVAMSMVLLGQLLWSMKHYKIRKLAASVPQKHLPTVSVCIPARNEDHALVECLHSVLSSDYPKMEVIVLDDCSQDATSQIVRSFAHDGVRFIQGDTPAEGWLGKNQAMQSLAEHVAGDLILFMSVDTRLDKRSITLLVNYMLSTKLDMVTVLPQNRLGLEKASLFTTLQYFWQIVLPVTKRRVPVSSKCWLISAKALQHLGGFASVKHKIVPEGSFARRLFSVNAYRFIISSSELGITTAKRWQSQVDTSLRLLYPTLKRQPLFALGGFLACILLVLPFITFIWQLVAPSSVVIMLASGVAIVLLFMVNALVLLRTHPRSWLVGVWLFPFTMLQEAMLVLVSMSKYEFGQVGWKGRNVCYPVITGGRVSSPR